MKRYKKKNKGRVGINKPNLRKAGGKTLKVLIVIGFLAILGYLAKSVTYTVTDTQLNRVKKQTKEELLHYANEIDKLMESFNEIPADMAYTIGNTHYAEADLLSLMKSVIEYNDEIFGSCVAYEPHKFNDSIDKFAPYLYKSGDSIAFLSLATNEYDYLNKAWYKDAKSHQRAIWTEPYYDEGGGGAYMVTHSIPLIKEHKNSSEFVGILTIDVTLDVLNVLLKPIKTYKNGFVLLLSESGKVIAGSDKFNKNIGTSNIWSVSEGVVMNEVKKYSFSFLNQSAYEETVELKNGNHLWFLSRRLSSAPWILVIGLIEEDVG